MQCPACNATIRDGVSRCPQCGTQVTAGGDANHPRGGGQPRGGGGGGGQPPRGAQSDQPVPGGQGGQGSSAQGGQPAQTPGQVRGPAAPGGNQGGGAAPGGHQGQHSGATPGQQGGATPGQQGGGYQQRPPGPSLSTQARNLFSELPWRGGIIAGVVVYVFGYASLAVMTTGLGSNMDGLSVAAELFFGIVSFVSASDLVVQVFTPGPDASQELLSGRYDGFLGLVYLVVPALLYLTGRKFAEWNATDEDGVDLYLATGATVVLGTLPVSIGLAVLAGTNVVRHVLIAGLFVPGLAGVFGSFMAWVFRDNARTASYGAGVFTGLLGYALVFVYILATAAPLLGVASGGLLLVALAAVFVVVNVTAFAFGAGGVVGFVLVALPVVGLGYLRASRGPDDVGDVFDGARAGASLVAGFASFVFVPLAVYALLTSPAGADVTGGNTGLVFGPQATSGITLITSPGALLQTFLIAGVVFPVVFGGIGGAIAGYVASEAGRGRPMQGQQPGPGGRPRQTRQQQGQPPAGQSQNTQPVQSPGNQPVQGRGQSRGQSPPPARGPDQSQPPGQSGSPGESQPPADQGETGESSDDQQRAE